METLHSVVQLVLVAILWLCATAVVVGCLMAEELDGFFLVMWGSIWFGITAMLRYSAWELRLKLKK